MKYSSNRILSLIKPDLAGKAAVGGFSGKVFYC